MVTSGVSTLVKRKNVCYLTPHIIIISLSNAGNTDRLVKMDRCLELLNKITCPLDFAVADGGRHLHLIKDLEKTMLHLADRLNMEMQPLAFPPAVKPDEPSGTELLRDFSHIFTSFDQCTLEDKEKKVKQALLLLRKIRDAIVKKLPGAPNASSDHGELPKSGSLPAAAPFTAAGWAEKLALPVSSLKGVGPRTAQQLARKGLTTIEDLIYFLPRCYEDRRFTVGIAQARVGRRETVVGMVASAEVKRYGKRPVFEVTIEDGDDLLKAKWFRGNPSYLKGIFTRGNQVILTGNVGQFQLQKEMLHPDFEMLDQGSDNLLHFKRIVPIYSETEGLYQKNLRRIMQHVVDDYRGCVLSPIPEDICRKQQLIDIHDALQQVHFPGSDQNPEDYNAGKTAAHRRLIFDEFFFFQLGLALQKTGQGQEEGIAFKTGGRGLRRFYEILPFPLTTAQWRVIGEIEQDMARPGAMNRLLQGDVGCGKTVVAMAAMVTACDNGCQAVLMAPTEILAEQHYANIREWAKALPFEVALLTGKNSAAEKRDIYRRIREGEAAIIVGTHALIQEEVVFHRLGLAVIDEQHRFGVVQRAALRAKGGHPDILVMTATPIPRTLAMTVYGDLDVSVIDEMPPGHKPVHTRVFFERQRRKVYELIAREISKGCQVFIVYPLVEGSEYLDVKDATTMAEHLQKDVFPQCRVGLLHGKMKKTEKEGAMAAFRAQKLDILVATTVIEVGIDIPAASLMVVEHAERFGLSQLHQLRGRVGRGAIPSSCILLTQSKAAAEAGKRLRVMEKTTDGFLIAEEDLALRGPGEFMGTRQSGLPDFRIANLIRDGKILQQARNSATELAGGDPRLESPAHRLLKEELIRRWTGRLGFAQIS